MTTPLLPTICHICDLQLTINKHKRTMHCQNNHMQLRYDSYSIVDYWILYRKCEGVTYQIHGTNFKSGNSSTRLIYAYPYLLPGDLEFKFYIEPKIIDGKIDINGLYNKLENLKLFN